MDELVNIHSTGVYSKTNEMEILGNTSDALTGIGIDIQEVNELFPNTVLDLKSNEEITSIFSQQEIAYAETKINPLQTLTGIFSAKEAIFKTGYINNLDNYLKKIEIKYNEEGKPQYKNFSLSISHSKDFAVAIAIHANISQKEKNSEDKNFKISTITNDNTNNYNPKAFNLQNIILIIILSSLTFTLLPELKYLIKNFMF
jgi:phosphopantetheine--protein transferase-like protein